MSLDICVNTPVTTTLTNRQYPVTQKVPNTTSQLIFTPTGNHCSDFQPID